MPRHNPSELGVLLSASGAPGPEIGLKKSALGISADKKAQRQSLEWIIVQSEDPRCIRVLASHDAAVQPKTIEF